MIIGTAAHEYFHLWNVKRIRPAEMWPYDYSRENETPLLWVSEGFTNYYGQMARYRAGLQTPENFLQSVADAASGVENTDARNYISPAEASVSTWAGYDTPVAFGISYYTQGQNLGALLDLSIRNDSDGRASLDDVMRALFNDHYKRKRLHHRGHDLIISKLTKKDYHDFYSIMFSERMFPTYDRIFGYAGYKVEKKTDTVPDLGFFGRFRNGGLTSIGRTNSGAAAADFAAATSSPRSTDKSAIGFPMGSLAGQTAKFTVSHGGSGQNVPVKIGSRNVTGYVGRRRKSDRGTKTRS